MGRTYKDRLEALPKRVGTNKRAIKKAQVREASKKNRGDQSYNKVELEEYEEDNFEKFTKKK